MQATPDTKTLPNHLRLEKALDQLGEKLGSLDEWMARADSNFVDFQLRWQVCSENITAQLAQVEQDLGAETERPQLRIF